MRVLVVATILACFACGKSRAVVNETPRDEPDHPPAPRDPGKARGPLATEGDALRAFDAAFTEEVRPILVTWHPSYASYRPGPFEQLTRRSCREASAEQQLRGGAESSRFFGDRSVVARDGDCWVLYQDNWGAPHPYAVLDAETGALLYGSFASCG